MSKQTGWIIVATAGATVDGRTITEAWIKDMAAQYSPDEYQALIWPEHFRSSWAPFDGKNWGTVDELKAAKKGGALRLFAKITANDYLLLANKDGQKLFTSIEADPDYKGSGRCYLRGLAVTDSPASTGTTRLKFSIGTEEKQREYSQLESLVFTQDPDSTNPDTNEHDVKEAVAFFRGFKKVFGGLFGESAPHTNHTEPEDTDVTKEELAAELAKQLQPFSEKLGTLETKVNAFSQQEAGDNSQGDGGQPKADQGEQGQSQSTEPQGGQQSPQFSAEQLSKALNDAVNPLAEKLNGLENKFNALTQEAPGQRPGGTGGGESAPDLV
ncbi:GPO family capsid scaffolding protein [Salinivibrio sp. KP-1]|uniref:GPO family capsid scaffolding protein n=1 Tax=Salinivibrio sp. KP-1 TaxID=1406902 RepID=UPI0006148D2A|nr:GPO family capsid scaffolding protein [Salinivibrio sp. KP-1]KKA45141.1 hypothetical protein WN56_06940 [Salinivibrio sp. KP-1]